MLESINAQHLWIFCYHGPFILLLTYQTGSASTQYLRIDNHVKPLILHIPEDQIWGLEGAVVSTAQWRKCVVRCHQIGSDTRLVMMVNAGATV